MKKIWILLLTLSVLFVGCGDKNNKEDKIVIKYGLWDSVQEPVFRDLADQFEKENPNIEIEIENTPYSQYWTKLQASSTGGVAPDVIWMNGPSIMKYTEHKMLLPLDEMVKKDSIDLGKYVKGIKELYNYKGVQYGIPKDVDSQALWYNKDLFDKAGVPYPKNDWTWDDMKKAAIEIQSKLEGVYGIAIPFYDDQGSFYNIIPQNDGFIISEGKKTSGYGNPEAIKAIQMMRDLIDEKASPDYTTILENKATEMFQSEKVAMTYQGSWRASPLNSDEKINTHIGVVKMPKIKKSTTVVHGIGYAITKGTKHPEASWEFIKFLASKKANDFIAKSGITIPAYVESQNLWASNYKNIDVTAHINALKDNISYPVSLDTAKWSHVQNEYLAQVWTGTMSAEEACKKIKVEMDEILKKEK